MPASPLHTSSPRLLLIANPRAAAGRAEARWRELLDSLQARGLAADHCVTAHPQHAVTLAREAAGRYDSVMAVGGDGTVNEVASGLLLAGRPETALGIIPFGTGNDVAQLIGIPTPEDALAALLHGESAAMDVIEVCCQHAGTPVTRYALLYATVGFAGELLQKTTPLVKRLFGRRYCWWGSSGRSSVTTPRA